MDDFQIEVPLSRLVVVLKMERVEYEPEQFPGLILPGRRGDRLRLLIGEGDPRRKDPGSMEAFASGLKARIEKIV